MKKKQYAFISYSHNDIKKVRMVVGALRKKNYNFWLDDSDIAGADFNKKIASAIKHSSMVIFFITPSSITKEYVKKEISYAHQQGKNICPVMLEDCVIPEEIAELLPLSRMVCQSDYDDLILEIAVAAAAAGCQRTFSLVVRLAAIGTVVVFALLILGLYCLLLPDKTHTVFLSNRVRVSYVISDDEVIISAVEKNSAEDKTIVVPSVMGGKRVTEIGYKAWTYSDPHRVIISYGIERVDDYAFMSCHLNGIELPNTITHIGEQAFSHCIELTSITIPSGVKSIGSHAFYNCNITVTAPYSPDYYGYEPDEGVTWIIE